MSAISSYGDGVALIVATAGTPVAAALPSVSTMDSYYLVSNRTNGYALFSFGTATSMPTLVFATVNGGAEPGFSLAPNAQIVVTVPAGVAYAYGNSAVAGSISVKPVSNGT